MILLNGNERGRSMVEILGVLAIIAVLTVGGIIGYTYAMDYYRENETLDQYTKTIVGAMTGRILENYGPEAEDIGPIEVPLAEIISGVKQKDDWTFETTTGSDVWVEVNNSQSFSVHGLNTTYGVCKKLLEAHRALGFTYVSIAGSGAAYFPGSMSNEAIDGFCIQVDPEKRRPGQMKEEGA